MDWGSLAPRYGRWRWSVVVVLLPVLLLLFLLVVLVVDAVVAYAAPAAKASRVSVAVELAPCRVTVLWLLLLLVMQSWS